jgi:hypothetical protein
VSHLQPNDVPGRGLRQLRLTAEKRNQGRHHLQANRAVRGYESGLLARGATTNQDTRARTGGK